MAMLPALKILYNATKKKFPNVAKQLKTKDSLVFRLTFGNTVTDWQLQGRFDYMSESLMIVNKSVFLEFMNKEDEQAYKEFASFAAMWVHHYE